MVFQKTSMKYFSVPCLSASGSQFGQDVALSVATTLHESRVSTGTRSNEVDEHDAKASVRGSISNEFSSRSCRLSTRTPATRDAVWLSVGHHLLGCKVTEACILPNLAPPNTHTSERLGWRRLSSWRALPPAAHARCSTPARDQITGRLLTTSCTHREPCLPDVAVAVG